MVEVFKEEPVFEGQFSNQCYSDRITEALEHFNDMQPTNFLDEWDHLVFHLPYAYHGRRIIFRNWLDWVEQNGHLKDLVSEIGEMADDRKTWERLAVKSDMYRRFVSEKIEKGERASSIIGNMYTGSIFMALLSLLRSSFEQNEDLSGEKIGFFAYGSGSKSKVFEGTVQKGWQHKIESVEIFDYLDGRSPIDIALYEQIHRGAQETPVHVSPGITLKEIETERR